MVGAFLIMLREGLEAALVVGVVLAVLARLGRMDYGRHVAAGVVAAVLASIAFAFAAGGVSNLFEGAGQEVLDGFILAVAAAMLTYVVVWVRGARKGMASELSRRVEAKSAAPWGIFVLVFLTVFREGFEAVLFLWGLVAGGAGGGLAGTLAGTVLGLGAAGGVAWLLFAGGRRIPLGLFFDATMVLLVLLAAGMLAGAAGFWVSVDWLPPLAYSVWDTRHVLPEGSGLGTVFHTLLGYNANPTLMEVLVYTGYLLAVGLWLALGTLRRAPRRAASS